MRQLFLYSARAVVVAAALSAATAQAQTTAAPTISPTLSAIKARGALNCGVIGTSANFSLPDSKGVMRGIDADACRALAAAIFGDAEKVKFVNLAPAQRLPAVQSGEVDIAYAQITWTMTRETKSGIQFTAVNFYDTWGFLVPKAAKIASTAALNGASVCIIAGPGEANAAEYFGKINVRYKAVPFSEGEQMRKAFLAKRCDVMFHDAAAIASFKQTLGAQGDDYVMLAETHGREPLAGAVRKGDDRWLDIAHYTHNAMVAAEELGISSKNIKSFASSNDRAVKRLLGVEGDLGPSMGLDKEWAAHVISQVGNYGEMWERAFAASSMPRGPNRLAGQGGLQYAVPMQ